MARNEEKAQAMLNRFVAAKSAANKEDKSQRPYLASDCDNLSDCELHGGQIIKEISKRVSLIQSEGLEETKVRDINDAINKFMREKGHWERQIKLLGGPDYFALHQQLMRRRLCPGNGYRYYGAAKKLLGVRELFSRAPPERQKRTRFEMIKAVDADYYGYRDDDDGLLGPLEEAASAERLARLATTWETERARGGQVDSKGISAEQRELASIGAEAAGERVIVPDEAAIKKAVLARRKHEILAKLAVSAEKGEPERNASPVPSLDTYKGRLPAGWD